MLVSDCETNSTAIEVCKRREENMRSHACENKNTTMQFYTILLYNRYRVSLGDKAARAWH